MKTTFRFERQTCHAPYDVEVSLEASESPDTRVLFALSLAPHIMEALEIGIRKSLASEQHEPMCINVIGINDYSGGTPQADYTFCAEYATNRLISAEHKNPIGVPEGT
jgi:hypothetical protein